jgi:hypothetical protein
LQFYQPKSSNLSEVERGSAKGFVETSAKLVFGINPLYFDITTSHMTAKVVMF